MSDKEIMQAAIDLYKAPFSYDKNCGWIFDTNNNHVADKVADNQLLRIRGWGRISYLKNAEQLQDAVGELVALALTEYWNRQKTKEIMVNPLTIENIRKAVEAGSAVCESATGEAIFINTGEEPDYSNLNCPACGGSGHVGDADNYTSRIAELEAEVARLNVVREWQPIETAPDETVVLVGFKDEFGEERYCFDAKDDGVWIEHADLYDNFISVAKPEGSNGPKERAPYTHWKIIEHIPNDQDEAMKGGA